LSEALVHQLAFILFITIIMVIDSATDAKARQPAKCKRAAGFMRLQVDGFTLLGLVRRSVQVVEHSFKKPLQALYQAVNEHTILIFAPNYGVQNMHIKRLSN
jgi:hypothetical protein